jgi:hypothetical protein
MCVHIPEVSGGMHSCGEDVTRPRPGLPANGDAIMTVTQDHARRSAPALGVSVVPPARSTDPGITVVSTPGKGTTFTVRLPLPPELPLPAEGG